MSSVLYAVVFTVLYVAVKYGNVATFGFEVRSCCDHKKIKLVPKMMAAQRLC